MRLLLLIAFRNLVRARRRTVLISLAIGLVTMLLVVLLALSRGLTETMRRNVTVLAAGHVNVIGWHKLKPQDAIPIAGDAAALRSFIEQNTPGVDYVVDRIMGWGKVIGPEATLQVAPYGIDAAAEPVFLDAVQLAKESAYKDGGRDEVLGATRGLAEPGTILISENQARRLGVTVGDTLSISVETEKGQANVLDATVTAVMKNSGMLSNWTVFVPKGTLQQLYDISPDTTGIVMVYLKDIGRAKETMHLLRERLEGAGHLMMEYDPQPVWMKFERVMGEDWTGQKLDMTTWEDEAAFAKWILTAFDSISFFLIAVLTLIIAIGIMNAMWIAVRERTREIGTVRAIGFSRNGVLALFMTEAALLGLFATLLGGLAGALTATVLDLSRITVEAEAVRMVLMSETLRLSFSWWHVAAAIAAFTIVTCLAAVWPALSAARMPPVRAIQYSR